MTPLETYIKADRDGNQRLVLTDAEDLDEAMLSGRWIKSDTVREIIE